MRRELFLPTIEGEARLLLLIDAFSGRNKSLEGRTKLAKLDFFLRYPIYLARALKIRGDLELEVIAEENNNIEHRMIRYKYGPWDPSYYAILGRLIGKGLIETVPVKRGLGYRTTSVGKEVAKRLSSDESWTNVAARTKLLRRHLDLAGTTLKDFVYKYFPEVTEASWGDRL